MVASVPRRPARPALSACRPGGAWQRPDAAPQVTLCTAC